MEKDREKFKSNNSAFANYRQTENAHVLMWSRKNRLKKLLRLEKDREKFKSNNSAFGKYRFNRQTEKCSCAHVE